MRIYLYREDRKSLYNMTFPTLKEMGVEYKETTEGYSLGIPGKTIEVRARARSSEFLLVLNQRERSSDWGYTSRLLGKRDKYGYLALHRVTGESVFVSYKNTIVAFLKGEELRIWSGGHYNDCPLEAMAVLKKACESGVRLPRVALRAMYWPEVAGFARVSPFIMSGMPRDAGEALALAGVPFPEHFRDAEGVSPEVVRGCTLPGMYPLVAVRFPDSLLDKEIQSSGLVCFHTISRLGERWLFCAATEPTWKISVGSYLYADAGGLRVGKSRQSW